MIIDQERNEQLIEEQEEHFILSAILKDQPLENSLHHDFDQGNNTEIFLKLIQLLSSSCLSKRAKNDCFDIIGAKHVGINTVAFDIDVNLV